MSKTEELLKAIKAEKSTMIAEIMDDNMKKGVLECEMRRLDELVPFVNKGMEEAFQEEEAIIIVKDNSIETERNNDTSGDNSLFTLQTESGKIIGESIYDEDELEELLEDPNVTFISENFVMYNNIASPGEKQFFLMTSTNSDFFTDADLESIVSSITVAIPSTETDHFIRDCFGLDHNAPI